MMAQIIAETPKWVFVVFFVLLSYGYVLTRTRALNVVRVLMLPIIMALFSIVGVFTSFGPQIPAMAAWALGFILALGMNRIVRAPAGVTYDPATRLFHIPGTWAPLGLMMAIFFAKYFVGAMTAMQPVIATTVAFAAALSLVFGVLSGTFFARFLQIWASRNRSIPASVPDTDTVPEPIR